jgi:hypothetical protein
VVGVRPVRQRAAERIVELQPALLRKLDRERAHEHLRDREDRKRRVGGHGGLRLPVGDARAARPEQPTANDDRRGHSRGAVPVALHIEHLLQLARVRRVGCLLWRRLLRRLVPARAAATREQNRSEPDQN